MINKLVILRYAPYGQNVSLFFSIDYLIKSGISIEYWDVSSITTGESGGNSTNEPINISVIRSYKELAKYIKSQDKSTTLFIPFMSFFCKTFRCFYLLSKYDCRLGCCVTGFFPTTNRSSREKVVQLLKICNFKKLYYAFGNLICNYIKNKTSIIKPCDVIYYTGSKAVLNEYKFDEGTAFFKLNSIDYEHFSMSDSEEKPKLEKESYMVFIDQYLPFHPDAKINGFLDIDPKGYYRNLNEFFNRLEQRNGMKVVIAAHPKAIKYKTHDYFNHRTVYWGVTNELVRNAKLVIMHFSTSVSFSVLYNKPVVFVSMPEIKSKNWNYHHLILAFAEALEACYYFLDNDWTLNEEIQVNDRKYEDYKYAYLTTTETECSINGVNLMKSLLTL